MTKQFEHDMNSLHRDILSLCTTVEEMINNAALALVDGKLDLATQVTQDDSEVNKQEVNIENECVRMLALHRPVASDLRRIAIVIKVNNELERIGDLAVSIGDRARSIHDHHEFVIPDGVDPMVDQVTQMIRKSLDSFVNLDPLVARQVIEMDDVVDDLNIELINKLEEVMKQQSHLVTPALHCFSAIRHLERIADLATNIAEDVIYLVGGEIVRHQPSTLNLLSSSYVKDDCIDH